MKLLKGMHNIYIKVNKGCFQVMKKPVTIARKLTISNIPPEGFTKQVKGMKIQ